MASHTKIILGDFRTKIIAWELLAILAFSVIWGSPLLAEQPPLRWSVVRIVFFGILAVFVIALPVFEWWTIRQCGLTRTDGKERRFKDLIARSREDPTDYGRDVIVIFVLMWLSRHTPSRFSTFDLITVLGELALLVALIRWATERLIASVASHEGLSLSPVIAAFHLLPDKVELVRADGSCEVRVIGTMTPFTQNDYATKLAVVIQNRSSEMAIYVDENGDCFMPPPFT